MIPDDVSKQIDKKNWVGVMISAAFIIVGTVWITLLATQKNKDEEAKDCAEKIAAINTLMRNRFDSIIVAHNLEKEVLQNKIDDKSVQLYETQTDLLKQIREGLVQIKPLKKLEQGIIKNTQEIKKIDSIRKQLP